MKSRITVTKKANGRFYLGMDADAAEALVSISRWAIRNDWHAVGDLSLPEVAAFQDAGDRMLTAIEKLRDIVKG